MCQLEASVAVADGVEAGAGGAHARVGDDVSASVCFDSGFGEAFGHDRSAAYGHDYCVGLKGFGAFLAVVADGAHALVVGGDGGDGGAEDEFDAAAGEHGAQALGNLFVEGREHFFKIFDDSHFHAKSVHD